MVKGAAAGKFGHLASGVAPYDPARRCHHKGVVPCDKAGALDLPQLSGHTSGVVGAAVQAGDKLCLVGILPVGRAF